MNIKVTSDDEILGLNSLGLYRFSIRSSVHNDRQTSVEDD